MRWRETIVQKDSDAAEFDSHDRKNYGWPQVRDFVGQCQDTASRFVGSVPRYRLDWIVVSYSSAATGAFWDTLLVVASGAPIHYWCLTRSVAFERRRSHSLQAVALLTTSMKGPCQWLIPSP